MEFEIKMLHGQVYPRKICGLKPVMDLLNNAACFYGIAIFLSLTMVGGYNAIEVHCTYGSVAAISSIPAI